MEVLVHCADTRPGCSWWGNVSLACFEESGHWWFGEGFSDNVSHSLGGTCHGRCSRDMVRGLEICVLDGVSTRSLGGSGCEPFAGVHG